MKRAILPALLLLLLTAGGMAVAFQRSPSGEPAGPAYSVVVRVPVGYRAVVSVEPEGSTPRPEPPPHVVPPAPSPQPAPDPGPAAFTLQGPFHLVMVHDAGNVVRLPPGQQALVTSRTIAPAVREFGGQWQRVDTTDPVLQSTKWGRSAAIIPPALAVIEDSSGQWITTPLPADEAAILARLRSIVK